MPAQQLLHHRCRLPALHQLDPVLDHALAAGLRQGVQAPTKERRVLHEIIVVLQQQLDALGRGQLQVGAGAGTHRLDQGVWQVQVADFLAFALQKNRPCRVKVAQGVPDVRVKGFLARLRPTGHMAQHRAAVAGQGFQVKYLRALRGQRLQQAGFAAAGGAAEHTVAQARGLRWQVGQQGGAPGFVAAFDQRDLKPDRAQYGGQRAAALTTAPAIQQRAPVFGLADDFTFDVGGNIARRYNRSVLPGFKRADLFVEGAYVRALGVVQRGPVEGAKQVVERVFVFAAGIDYAVEISQPQQGLGRVQGMNRHGVALLAGPQRGSKPRSTGQTLASMSACAASLG